MANPSTAPAGGAFSFVFVNTIRPLNPMVYDLSDTLNTGIAILVGVLLGTLAYILIFPPDPKAARRYVTYRIRRGLQSLAVMREVPASFSHWETRMYDRVVRLNDPENPSANMTDEWLDAGLGALTLGNEIIRLRHWVMEEPLPAGVRPVLEWIIAALGGIFDHPEPAYAALQRGRDQIAQMDPGPGSPERAGWARVFGALEEMDAYLAEHPRLLNRAPIP
jgi:uncharacterized membrane protein YccC